VFIENAELGALYPEQHFDQGDWVVARWLELIPVKLAEKNLFVDKDSYSQAKELLQSIILSE
jgi:Lon protease-like protein